MPADLVRQADRARPGHQQRQPVAPYVGGQGHALQPFREGLHPPGVHHDILACRQEGDQHRRPDQPLRPGYGIGQRQQQAGQRQQGLDDQQPAAAASQGGQAERRPNLVKQRGP